jgi:ribosomal protein S14
MNEEKAKMKAQEKKRPLKRCWNCGNSRAIISKYGLGLCRRCFKENASMMGFKKYS